MRAFSLLHLQKLNFQKADKHGSIVVRAVNLSPFSSAVLTLRADVCKYRPEVGKMNFLKNPKKIM